MHKYPVTFKKNVLNDNHTSGRNKLQVMSVVKEVKSFESAYNLSRYFTIKRQETTF